MANPQSSFFYRLKEAIRFLLFLERDPKHRVAQDLNPSAIMFFPIITVFLGYISFLMIQYGFLAMCFSGVGMVILFTEFFHVIYDR